MPEEFGALIKGIKDKVTNIDKAVISVHCHNDLGLAVANALAAIRNGAEQVECTINGIGERAGNCSMEEVVMALRTRKDFFGADTRIHTEEITRTSRLVTKITGIPVQPNKAIVGANAFAHESGIHQDGLLKERTTYEIMTPESIGLVKTNLVLGKHSGRHAFRDRLKQMGYELSDDDLNKAFERFKRRRRPEERGLRRGPRGHRLRRDAADPGSVRAASTSAPRAVRASHRRQRWKCRSMARVVKQTGKR